MSIKKDLSKIIEVIKNKENFMVTDEIKNKRLSICKQCEYLKLEHYMCKQCGCFMRMKTSLNGTNCPIGKW